MLYTAILILAYLVYHMLTFRFVDHSIGFYQMVTSTFRGRLFTAIYIGGAVALVIHLTHGMQIIQNGREPSNLYASHQDRGLAGGAGNGRLRDDFAVVNTPGLDLKQRTGPMLSGDDTIGEDTGLPITHRHSGDNMNLDARYPRGR